MKMKDWVEELNIMLKTNRYEVLENNSNISDFDKIIDECKSKK